jgi:uncharacterized membrane protein
MNFMGMAFGFGIALLFYLIIAGISILAFIFWILMLVDCIKRKFKEDSEKLIGALIYYFVVKYKKR